MQQIKHLKYAFSAYDILEPSSQICLLSSYNNRAYYIYGKVWHAGFSVGAGYVCAYNYDKTYNNNNNYNYSYT